MTNLEVWQLLLFICNVRGTITDGKDMAEDLHEVQDALAEAIAAAMKNAKDLPLPSSAKRGQLLVTLPAAIAVKAALYISMRE